MTRLIGIYGASGFGREVLPLLRAQGQRAVFIDDRSNDDGTVNGTAVVNWEGFLASPERDGVVVAIADSRTRERLSERVISAGLELTSLRAVSVVEQDEVSIGQGSILCDHVSLMSNSTIGRSFHANIYSYVAHDCVIGDYVTFAPRVSCNGNVHIDDHAYIGTGAIIRQGTPEEPMTIGEGAVVGMGAVVTKPVPAGATVVGNPARIMER